MNKVSASLLLPIEKLKRSLQYLFAFLGCLHLCGGPTGVMQCVAWLGMTISYSAQDGLVEGVKKTFDGEHPCPMCQAIAKVKKDQEEQSPVRHAPTSKEVKALKDLSVLEVVTMPDIVWRELSIQESGSRSALAGRLPNEPQSPPPRLV